MDICITIQNKFAYRVVIIYLQEKDFCNEDNYIDVHGCLLRECMSMEKVTKHLVIIFMCFMCLTYPWRELQKRYLTELLELNTLNEHFSYEILMRKKYLFIWKSYI